MLGNVRISGDDLWNESMERGFAICSEIVSDTCQHESVVDAGQARKVLISRAISCGVCIALGVITSAVVDVYV